MNKIFNPKTNNFAAWGFGLSIFEIMIPILGIIGLILGIVGLNQIKKTKENGKFLAIGAISIPTIVIIIPFLFLLTLI